MNNKNIRLKIILLIVALILSVPLIAMQFTKEVNWSLFDFAAAFALVLGTGLLCEIVMRKVHKITNRIAICIVLFLLLGIVWAELAIGIFGTPFAGS